MSEGPSRRTVFLTVSAVLTAALLIVSHAVLLPFVLALVVAYVLTPAVLRLERARVPRWAAILVVYALVLSGIAGFFALSVPRLIAEGKALTAEAPRLAARLREEYLPALDARLNRWSGREPEAPPPANAPAQEPDQAARPPDSSAAPAGGEESAERPPIRILPGPDGSFDVQIADDVEVRETRDGVWQIAQARPRHRGLSSANMLQEGYEKGATYLKENSLAVLRIGQAIATAISRGIFNLFMTLMLAGYIILTHEKILRFFRELWHPTSRDSFDRFLRRLDRGLSGVVRGQLLICLVNGVLSAIGFWLFDLKYWPILSVLAAVMSLIPIFGSILSSVPAVLIGLTQSFGTAAGVLAWIVGIHQLEANFLNPKIIGDSAKIHPVLVVLSLLVGEHFFQITGALFAVPCLSLAQTIFLHFRESTLGLADPTATIPPQRGVPIIAPTIEPLPPLRGFESARPASTPVPAAEPEGEPSARSSDPDRAAS
ncbi:AI-2E family transporter [Sorangium atrum]|uniref:AI-2E family transporter n=1 Tax=Sorangium atrum TaxID=2995308 RepID=A0ABT5CJC6_9BACT|nr:AI-2E family transporter [Sorangium aterium]MDC0685904.1 AI-2E family transporter [Sorangium aterium]